MPGEINTKARDLSFQAIEEFAKDAAKGNFQGRLVVEEKGKNSRISYEKFSEEHESTAKFKENLSSVREFCKTHKIDTRHLDEILPPVFAYSDTTRREWKESLSPSMRKNEVLGALREARQLELDPPVTLEEVKKVLEFLTYPDLCKIIDGYKKETGINPLHKKVLKVLEDRELHIAMESVKEYKAATHRDMTLDIMKQKESPLTNMGCRELLNWGMENEKTVLVSALMRRITRAEAKEVLANKPDQVWIDKFDQSIWLL